MNKVVAILLCYNTHFDRLKEILDSLLNQSYPLEKILIWDNASVNNLENFIRESFSLYNSKIIYYKSSENLGAGGGFASAINYLFENFKDNFDWVWLIEDDVKPDIRCLEELIDFIKKNESIKAVAPFIFSLNGDPITTYTLFNPSTLRFMKLVNLLNEIEINYVPTNFNTFEGLLIKNEILRKIKPSNQFFYAHDDVLFSFIVSLYFGLIRVKTARLIKLKNSSKLLTSNLIYYMNRNMFLLIRELSKVIDFSLEDKIIIYFSIFYRSIKYILYSIIKAKSIKSLLYTILAFYHGIKGRFGKYL